MSIDDKNLEDMNKEERQQYVDMLNRQHQKWVEAVPLLTPEQSAAIRFPDGYEANFRRQMKEAREKIDRRMQKWIEKGGSPDDLD